MNSDKINGLAAFAPNATTRPSANITSGLKFEEPLIFERSQPGRKGFSLHVDDWDVPALDVEDAWDDALVRAEIAELPEVSEPEVVRHYTRMSQWNFSIDTGFYPLGSCTMKYNPKINEGVARLAGFANLHPYMPDEWCQGALELLYRLQGMLCEISGLAHCSLQPAAGAQGELAGLMCIRAYHEARGDTKRTKIIVPESAHGTNPASAAFNGFEVVEVKCGEDGRLHPDALHEVMSDEVAGLMITNPSTMGLFETHIAEICRIVHQGGGKVYMDGANMNAILGKARPGDFGVDVMHFNVHKTFSTPHGGGGPGAGPICVVEDLGEYLPVPRVSKRGEDDAGPAYYLDFDHPNSVGKLKAFWGNFLVYVRGYTYLSEYGWRLETLTEMAVLNANYLRVKLNDMLDVEYQGVCMHEVAFNDSTLRARGIETLDLAKRLIDYGFHPPTVYFPLNIQGALMVEPTETESRQTLDSFVDALRTIIDEAEAHPELLKKAPYNAFRTRLDETRAARNPILTYKQLVASRAETPA
ncbi:aminomethyl-transferring glycine dehydrogenase subunit GcvPB [Bradymonas sediminis]|uniref:Probable glycine dehydrogenase (decarboxylating) subunit 2 n=1 Tax=Bradymonas sediminis TaxID=1548548 RepID=A0A2Z4FKY9_9DELT|nr:aminomethyl-transferring glycine dehydrogenase subunit GcvPB [Bradymonas sediminis]AWV89364.1 aminomethyl-transferring glycine dehydrogenase subunit GcvPB [Bradymonas sediminis]TDP73544.1 glycine dehydrogenase (decarboxylating) beta subunit [Bradymonas sediminis]